MIPEADRYHGVVLRQLVEAFDVPRRIGTADVGGRLDTYCVDTAAFQVKYSRKRLTPWRFTYDPSQLGELRAVRERYQVVWVFLVCGVDGVVGVSYEELAECVDLHAPASTWLSARRGRNTMYRIAGARGELARAKARGLQSFAAVVEACDLAGGGE